MLTVQILKEYGADTDEGLARCMGREDFYLRLVRMLSADRHTEELKEALGRGDLQAGFEAAHALKGVLANLALTPALKPVSEITEFLRARTDMDYQPLMNQVETEMAELMVLLNS